MYICARVYVQARAALAANKRSLIARHQPQHAHRPDIGINAFHPVEPSKDQFFQRLYDHRHQQNALAQVNSRKYFIQVSEKKLCILKVFNFPAFYLDISFKFFPMVVEIGKTSFVGDLLCFYRKWDGMSGVILYLHYKRKTSFYTGSST